MTLTTLPQSKLGTLSAISAGQGRPVLLLHGVGLCAQAWGAQIEALSLTHRVIAPDMPGHGESPQLEGPTGLGDYVTAAAAVLDVLGQPAMVVGHSMGAMIALELARLRPAQVAAVIALNSIYQRDADASAAVRARAASLDGLTVPDPEPTLRRWFGGVQSPERAACERWLRAVDPKGYQSAYRVFANAHGPSPADLSEITCPALFATGADEPNSTPEMSRQMAALAPRGRALIVPGAAHMMPMTHASEVNAAIAALAAEIWP